jgi:hypothetical protein
MLQLWVWVLGLTVDQLCCLQQHALLMMQDAQAANGSICVTLLLLLLFIWVVHCSQCGAQHQMLPHLIVSS